MTRARIVYSNGQAFRVIAGRREWLQQPPLERLLEIQCEAARAAQASSPRSAS